MLKIISLGSVPTNMKLTSVLEATTPSSSTLLNVFSRMAKVYRRQKKPNSLNALVGEISAIIFPWEFKTRQVTFRLIFSMFASAFFPLLKKCDSLIFRKFHNEQWALLHRLNYYFKFEYFEARTLKDPSSVLLGKILFVFLVFESHN